MLWQTHVPCALVKLSPRMLDYNRSFWNSQHEVDEMNIPIRLCGRLSVILMDTKLIPFHQFVTYHHKASTNMTTNYRMQQCSEQDLIRPKLTCCSLLFVLQLTCTASFAGQLKDNIQWGSTAVRFHEADGRLESQGSPVIWDVVDTHGFLLLYHR